jgi:hypothetical protein
LDCWWIISPQNATHLEIVFSEFEFEGPASCCVGDFVMIFECSDLQCFYKTAIAKLTGTMAVVPPSIVSRTGIMQVYLHSDGFWSTKGFNAKYFVPCPAGTYGTGMPDCTQCTLNCSSGRTLMTTSCGAIGSTIDNECSCPPGQYSRDNISSCLQCPDACDVGMCELFSTLCCCYAEGKL